MNNKLIITAGVIATILISQPALAKKDNKPTEASFNKIDKNSDGHLSLEEFSNRGKKVSAKKSKKAQKKFKKTDTNKDEQISLAEFIA